MEQYSQIRAVLCIIHIILYYVLIQVVLSLGINGYTRRRRRRRTRTRAALWRGGRTPHLMHCLNQRGMPPVPFLMWCMYRTQECTVGRLYRDTHTPPPPRAAAATAAAALKRRIVDALSLTLRICCIMYCVLYYIMYCSTLRGAARHVGVPSPTRTSTEERLSTPPHSATARHPPTSRARRRTLNSTGLPSDY